jgi:hypothetical protein
VDLGLYLFGGPPGEKTAAVRHLEKALAEWQKLAAVTREHYLPREIWQMGIFHWDTYTGAVKRDISIAQGVQAAPAETETWQVAATSSQPAWKTVSLRFARPFADAGLYSWWLYRNALFNATKVEQAAGPSASYLWRRILPASANDRWALAVPGHPRAQIRLNGEQMNSPLAAGTQPHGYRVYSLGGGGALEASLAAGIVPELYAVGMQQRPIDAPVVAAEVIAPLSRTAGGALELAQSVPMGRGLDSSILTEVNPAGSALFRIKLVEPGFYRVKCQLRGGKQAYYSLDAYNNGFDSSIFAKAAEGAPGNYTQSWLPALSDRAIALGPGEHTLRVYLRQRGEQIKKTELVPVVQ